MANKDINGLDEAQDFKTNDITFVRKITQQEDKSINANRFLNSIGNTAVDGFIATSTEEEALENKIQLTAVNGTILSEYADKMLISFISPIDSVFNTIDDRIELQIDNLGFIDLMLKNQNADISVANLRKNQFVEAYYDETDGVFYQINVENLFLTGDYVVTAFNTMVEDEVTITLTTANGIVLNNFYRGMTINFRCPNDTGRKGGDATIPKDVYIKINNSDRVQVLRNNNGNDYTHGSLTELYKGQIVRLILEADKDDPDNATKFRLLLDNFEPNDPRLMLPYYTENDAVIQPKPKQILHEIKGEGLKTLFDKIIETHGFDGTKTGEFVNVTIKCTDVVNIRATILKLFGSNQVVSGAVLGTYYNTMDLSWITLEGTNGLIKLNFISEKNVNLKDANKMTKFTSLYSNSGNGSVPFNISKNTTIVLAGNGAFATTSSFLDMRSGIISYEKVIFKTDAGTADKDITTVFYQASILTLIGCELLCSKNAIVFKDKNTLSSLSLDTCKLEAWNSQIIIEEFNTNVWVRNSSLKSKGTAKDVVIGNNYSGIEVYLVNTQLKNGCNKEAGDTLYYKLVID